MLSILTDGKWWGENVSGRRVMTLVKGKGAIRRQMCRQIFASFQAVETQDDLLYPT